MCTDFRSKREKMTNFSGAVKSAMVVLPCLELDATLQFFTAELGFRIEMITPADNPHTAIISGYGVRLCLRVGAAGDAGTLQMQSTDHSAKIIHAPNGTRIEIVAVQEEISLPPIQEELVISQLVSNTAWSVGRAGMRYRDLIPSRLGGRFIASHIHIHQGGPVPDYVHYHRIAFQMIYCYRGWVRVVYEDQGQPFVMNAGDCVLQPPEIRHRVLESSDDLEVIEIGCPAEHETFADHDLSLPTSSLHPDRLFAGQRFVRHVPSTTPWLPWRYDGFEVRNTGIDTATNGLASAFTVRAGNGAVISERSHSRDLSFKFVLSGSIQLRIFGEPAPISVESGSSVTVPSNCDYQLEILTDTAELLVVELPA